MKVLPQYFPDEIIVGNVLAHRVVRKYVGLRETPDRVLVNLRRGTKHVVDTYAYFCAPNVVCILGRVLPRLNEAGHQISGSAVVDFDRWVARRCGFDSDQTGTDKTSPWFVGPTHYAT